MSPVTMADYDYVSYRSLIVMLMRHEGLRLKPYRDTVGKLTIGVGRNLDDVGISKAEATALLLNDVGSAIDVLNSHFPFFYTKLSKNRRFALINMCFNLGIRGLKTFKRFLVALEKEDYAVAAHRMLWNDEAKKVKTKWYKQVGKRAEELSEIIRTDKLPGWLE